VDIGNNNISPEGLHPVAEFLKRTKSLQWFSLYMNDISDEVILLLQLFSACVVVPTKILDCLHMNVPSDLEQIS
jgi:hypothetical protein